MKIYLLVLLAVPFHAFSQNVIQVIDGSDNRIESVIFFSDSQGENEVKIGMTDSEGRMSFSTRCDPGQRVIAKPRSSFWDNGSKTCSEFPVEVKVKQKPLYANLKSNRGVLISKENFAGVALISNEMAARHVDPILVTEEREKTIQFIGKHLGIETQALVYDELQNRNVASSELIIAVKQYQKENGLAVSGKIDYKTLSTASNLETHSVMYEAVEP